MSLTTERIVSVPIDAVQTAKPSLEKKAPESSTSVMNVALRILEGIGLVFANIFTLGLINFLPGIHKEYSKVFGGKEIEVYSNETITQSSSSISDDNHASSSSDEVDDNHASSSSEEVEEKHTSSLTKEVEEKHTSSLTKEVDKKHTSSSIEEDNIGMPDCNTIVKRNLKSARENVEWIAGQAKDQSALRLGQLREGASIAYQAATKENAVFVKNQAVEASKRLYTAAKKPENVRTTAGVIGGVAATIIGVEAYLYSGGDPANVAAAIVTNATNGTLV